MSDFRLNRFSQALKCQFLVSRKAWLRQLGIFTLVVFFANLFFTRVAGPSYDTMQQLYSGAELVRQYSHLVEQELFFSLMFFCFALLYGASSLFNNMKDVRKRSSYLLWPVSHAEKYLVNLLHSIVLMAVLAIVAIVLADVLRVFVDMLTGRVVVWGFYRVTEPVTSQEYWQFGLAVVTWAVYFQSLFIVGGAFFRRYHFLLTSMAIIAATILIIIFLRQVGTVDLHLYDYVQIDTFTWNGKDYPVSKVVFNPSFYIVTVLGWIIIAFNYWLSYKLFCRMQVINHKWFNV